MMRQRWTFRSIATALTVAVAIAVLNAAVTAPDSCFQEDGDGDAIASCALTGVQAGDVVIAYSNVQTNNTLTLTVTDDSAATGAYTATTYFDCDAGGPKIGMSYALATGSGNPTVTATWSGSDFKFIAAAILRGAAAAGPTGEADDTGSGTSVATASLSTPAGYVTGQMVVNGAFSNTISPSNGGATLEEVENDTTCCAWNLSGEETSGGSQTITWTLGASANWCAWAHHWAIGTTTRGQGPLMVVWR